MASRGARPWSSTACICSLIGISTRNLRANSTVAAVVPTPSATMRIALRMSASFRPLPNSTPTERLRLSAPVQVSTRSPIPARPARVSRCPPRAVASRVISARPRVIRAAMVFEPSPSPSHAPAAIAMTFFTAPPSSTPVTSTLVYSRNVGPENSSCTLAVSSRSAEAITTAVGSLLATSRANEGPESAATPGVNFTETTCAMSSVIRSRVLSSRPLVALTKTILGSRCGSMRVYTARACAEGITPRTMSACRSAEPRSPVTSTCCGRVNPGRYTSLTRRVRSDSHTSASCTHSAR